ncbi:MAG: F0F1 ATP synthase subunit delta [Gammaproteobacteria bacterium]|nr:F0F1 ATP synthase subunit delta [Gammaproteobacteria bacterium]
MSDLITAARPYAKAVFETAKGDSAEANWSEVLEFLSSVIANEDMKAALQSPNMGAADKGELLLEISGNNLNDKQRNFIKLLAENGRLALIPDVAGLYEELLAEAQSKVEATVTSAYPISDAQQQAMTEALKKKLGCDVTLVTKIDESLIGGVVIKAGDLVIDGSAQARLNNLASVLTH